MTSFVQKYAGETSTNQCFHFLLFDTQIILGNGDARGLVFYIMIYSTKSTRTVSTILPLLAQAVTRIDKEGRDEPNDIRTKIIVRASLCRLLSGTELGAAAAVCKLMGWSDAIRSHSFALCRVTPAFGWIKRSLAEIADHDGIAPSQQADNVEDSDESDDVVVVTPIFGRLLQWITFIHRCHSDDILHPFYNMSYFMYNRLVTFAKHTVVNKKERWSRTVRVGHSGEFGYHQ